MDESAESVDPESAELPDPHIELDPDGLVGSVDANELDESADSITGADDRAVREAIESVESASLLPL